MASLTPAEFQAKYVTPNIPPGAKLFSADFFGPLHSSLSSKSLPATAILAGALVAFKRGDLVPELYEHVVGNGGAEIEKKTFLEIREGVNTVAMFVGAPQILPACLGMAGKMMARGYSEFPRDRPPFTDSEDLPLGQATHKDIYKASANTEVFRMLGAFFGDFNYLLTSVGFGYVMGRNSEVLALREKEAVLAASIVALGATRQARSHLMACVGFGWSREEVEAVVGSVGELGNWLSGKWEGLKVQDVGGLVDAAKKALEG